MRVALARGRSAGMRVALAKGRSAPVLRAARVRAAAAVATIAVTLAGCAGGGGAAGGSKAALSGSTPAQRRLQRADLAIAAHGLLQVRPSIRPELAASRAVWPAVVDGLPRAISADTREAIARAALRARAIATPHYISFAGQLTGVASHIAGLELSYEELVLRGWTLTSSAADYMARVSVGGSSLTVGNAPGEAGAVAGSAGSSGQGGFPATHAAGATGSSAREGLATAAAAGFLRVNAVLYIGCIYDAHHNLSTIGEQVKQAYAQLGGAAAFGAALRPAEVQAIAHFYSPAVALLEPSPPSSSAIGS
jgi:hypothetical protein